MNLSQPPTYVTCHICQGAISYRAHTCPHCGHPMRQEKGWGFYFWAVVAGILAASFVMVVLGSLWAAVLGVGAV